MTPRYEITELEGFANPTSQTSGCSFMVVDTLAARTVMATIRTEDINSKHCDDAPWKRRAYALNLAQAIVDDLNANPPHA